jgi:hypothetical protein
VTLILFFVAFMIGGDIVAYLFGLLVEYEFGTHVSLIAFLALYFFFLWVSGVLAYTERCRIKCEMKSL